MHMYMSEMQTGMIEAGGEGGPLSSIAAPNGGTFMDVCLRLMVWGPSALISSCFCDDALDSIIQHFFAWAGSNAS